MKFLPLFLILLVTPASGILIVELYPDPFAKNDETEYVKLYNPGNTTINLSGWILTDFESEIHLKGQISPHGYTVIARNGTSYRESFGKYPDFEWKNSSNVKDLDGSLRLSNSGDEVGLFDSHGELVDLVVYGKSWNGSGWEGKGIETFREGVILKRAYINGTYPDTDSERDWNFPRLYVEGQTDFALKKFSVKNVTIIVFPVNDWNFISADRSIVISSYIFENAELGSMLSRTAENGVSVRILLEKSPAGGFRDDVIRHMKPVQIYLQDTKAYRFMHAKYAVIDGSTVIVMTENWKNGNKGYGVMMSNQGLAEYFLSVFESDAKQSIPFRAEDGPGLNADEGGENQFIRVEGNITVIPVLSPDTSRFILDTVKNARERLLIELPYIQMYRDGNLSPFMTSILESAEKGARVRVLLDGSRYNTESNRVDNDDAVSYLNSIARERGYDLKAKLYHGKELHSKMFIADNMVYIGSMNWNDNSLLRNREAGVLMVSSDVAEAMEKLFISDWNERKIPFIISIPSAGLALLFIVLMRKRLN